MSNLTRFGIDLAKSSFAVCRIDEHGKIVLKKTLTRTRLLDFFANQPPAVVAMEAGSGAHHWARQLMALSPPQFVYCLGRNDASKFYRQFGIPRIFNIFIAVRLRNADCTII